jgi:hypothetical protein
MLTVCSDEIKITTVGYGGAAEPVLDEGARKLEVALPCSQMDLLLAVPADPAGSLQAVTSGQLSHLRAEQGPRSLAAPPPR